MTHEDTSVDIEGPLRDFVQANDSHGGELISVGPNAQFQTVQEAHDSLGNSWEDRGLVYMTEGYDGSAETFPIRWTKQASLMGCNNIINNNSGKDTLLVNVGAPINRPPGPRFYNFEIEGGERGIVKKGGRYTQFRDIAIFNCNSTGFYIADKQDYGGTTYAPNTHRLDNVIVENCGGAGFYLGFGIHGATLYNCNAYFNDAEGVYWNNNFGSAIIGGSYEQNGNAGIVMSGSQSGVISGTYIEKNSTNYHPDGEGLAIELWIGPETRGCTIEQCYFNGGDLADWSMYNNGKNIKIKECYSKYHKRGFLYNDSDAEDTDWYKSSHEMAGGEDFGGGDGIRTRSFGTIIPQDLTGVTGLFNGDTGVHIDGNGDPRPAVWYEGSWYTSDTSML